MIINYQMNAGHIPMDNWVHTEAGGGRIIGEACHVFDLFNYFTDAEVESVKTERVTPKTQQYSPRDNVVITLKYSDGSICSLTYTALGHPDYPKEFCQVCFDGKIIIIDDYKRIKGYGTKTLKIQTSNPDKGHKEELIEFATYVRGETGPPIPLWQIIQATETSFIADHIS
jgi:predicted dehydrogenase